MKVIKFKRTPKSQGGILSLELPQTILNNLRDMYKPDVIWYWYTRIQTNYDVYHVIMKSDMDFRLLADNSWNNDPVNLPMLLEKLANSGRYDQTHMDAEFYKLKKILTKSLYEYPQV